MNVRITMMTAGFCYHPEAVVRAGASWRARQFPSMFALIEHARYGNLLFDCGYSRKFFQYTQPFPLNIYAAVTPVAIDAECEAPQQLQDMGIDPASIRTIVISHFHADHVGTLSNFSNAQFIMTRQAYLAVKDCHGFAALKAGFIHALLPQDFEERSICLEDTPECELPPKMSPFDRGHDITGDGTILSMSLPGHVPGHTGLLVRTSSQGDFLLAGDACWTSAAFKELQFPHPIANLICDNGGVYRDTICRLHELHTNSSSLRIVPSHCSEAIADCEKLAGVGSRTDICRAEDISASTTDKGH